MANRMSVTTSPRQRKLMAASNAQTPAQTSNAKPSNRGRGFDDSRGIAKYRPFMGNDGIRSATRRRHSHVKYFWMPGHNGPEPGGVERILLCPGNDVDKIASTTHVSAGGYRRRSNESARIIGRAQRRNDHEFFEARSSPNHLQNGCITSKSSNGAGHCRGNFHKLSGGIKKLIRSAEPEIIHVFLEISMEILRTFTICNRDHGRHP